MPKAEKLKVICRNGPTLVVAVTVFVIAIGLDLYPGNAWGALLLFLFGMPLLLLAYALVFLVPWAMRRPRIIRFPSRLTLLIAVTVASLGVLLHAFSVPARLAFWSTLPAFGKARNVKEIKSFEGKRIGVWTVQEAALDEWGGLYLVTSTGGPMIDRVSGGIAYRPNFETTPYGAARYRLTHLGGDWYRFIVSDDWY